jgi:hypothetical protein
MFMSTEPSVCFESTGKAMAQTHVCPQTRHSSVLSASNATELLTGALFTQGNFRFQNAVM